MLFESSEVCSTGGEGYDPTKECLHIDSKIPDGGNHLDMPREGDQPLSLEPDRVQTPPESHMAHLEQLRELHDKIGEEHQRLQ